MKIVAIDCGKRVHPVVGVGETTPQGDKAACSQHTGWRVLAARAVTPGLLEATTEECEVMSGTRPPRVLQVIHQRGSQGDGHLRHRGPHTPPGCWKTAVLKFLNTCPELRWSCLAGCWGRHEMSDLVHPAEEPDSRLERLWEYMPDGSQAG